MILKNAPILILDEATSALDPEVENAIQQQLLGLMTGKIVIAIAHRLSTIARLDRLVVLEEAGLPKWAAMTNCSPRRVFTPVCGRYSRVVSAHR